MVIRGLGTNTGWPNNMKHAGIIVFQSDALLIRKNPMFKFVNRWLKRHQHIIFIDGDQDIPKSMRAYDAHVAGTPSTTLFVRRQSADAGTPRLLKERPEIQITYLASQEYPSDKEVVDKYIAVCIQKALGDGFTHITVISADGDFVDIFRMIRMINHVPRVSFKLISPSSNGRIDSFPERMGNITVVAPAATHATPRSTSTRRLVAGTADLA